jgi:hypothetical protein
MLKKALKYESAQAQPAEFRPDVDPFYLSDTWAEASKPTHSGELAAHPDQIEHPHWWWVTANLINDAVNVFTGGHTDYILCGHAKFSFDFRHRPRYVLDIEFDQLISVGCNAGDDKFRCCHFVFMTSASASDNFQSLAV